jgi:menaquinol-cytochrome c reductase iron-sulfur subunit
MMDTPAEQRPVALPDTNLAEDRASPEINRRKFTGLVATAFAAFIGSVLGLPALAYLAGPLRQRSSVSWISLGSAATLTTGTPKLVSLSVISQDGWRRTSSSRTVWVLSGANNEIVAFNGHCTHLGCSYGWQTGGAHADSFFCPCHEGVYDRSGTVLAGPPPRPLDRLETSVVDGELFVLFQDFRLGTPTKEQA